MQNIVEVEGRDLAYLINVLKVAQDNGQHVRLTSTSKGMQVSRGQSMWTVPFGKVTGVSVR